MLDQPQGERGDRDGLELEQLIPRFDAGQAEQVQNQHVQAIGLAGHLTEEVIAMFRVVAGTVQQGFDTHLDDRQRRLQFVRDVGHEVLTKAFEPAQLGGVVQDENSAPAGVVRRHAAQPGGVNGQAADGGAGPVDLLALRLGAVERPADDVDERPLADDLPQRPADNGLAGNIQQLPGAVVGEKDALVAVQRDDSLDHAAEDGAQLLAIRLQLGDAGGQAFADAVERLAQPSQIVVGGKEDAGVGGADVLDGASQLTQGTAKLPVPVIAQQHE